MRYTIGLDLGTTSVGWAVIGIDNDAKKIEDLGVRLFESAEHQKNGESLAKPRRDARSMRRRIARRRYRLEKVKNIFFEGGLLSRSDIDRILAHPNDPYRFRAEALDRALTADELFVAVYHLVKRRGYKSNRKKEVEAADKTEDKQKQKEEKAVLSSIQENEKELRSGAFRTPGELLWHEKTSHKEGVRNKPGSYQWSFSREMLEKELETILSRQQELGNRAVTEDIVRALVGKDGIGRAIGAFNFQRPFTSKEQIEKLVGKCTFERNEPRAAKATYRFEFFRALEKMNNIRIDGEPLSDEQREILLVKIKDAKNIDYAQIKNWLRIDKTSRFNAVSYIASRKEWEKALLELEGMTKEEVAEKLKDAREKKEKFPAMRAHYDIQKKIMESHPEYWENIHDDIDSLDQIGEILTFYKTDEDIKKELVKIDVPERVIDALLALSFSGFGHLSTKALKRLIPLLESGKRYDEAVAAIPEYKDRFPSRDIKLRPIPADDNSITNPVVRRTIAQTIKVMNAIIDRYGSPEEVHIELGRELAKDFKERRKIQKQQEENQERNNVAVQKIEELGLLRRGSPKGLDILKYRLYMQQNGKCGYSGKTINERRLLEQGYAEIDHIIPFSRSWDDSFSNKILVLESENREKGNRTPYEYMGGDSERWRAFTALVESFNDIGMKKRNNLLTKKYVGGDLTERTLNDTRFIARYLKNYIENTLQFNGSSDRKRRVYTINGMATAYLRKRWGLTKIREDGSKHHALDAAVVAVTTPSMQQAVATYAKAGEIAKYLAAHHYATDALPDVTEADKNRARDYLRKHENMCAFPEPWDGFRFEVTARVSDEPQAALAENREKIYAYKNGEDFSAIQSIFISRMPRRKITGRAHDETRRSPERFKNGQEASSLRVPLTLLTIEKLEKEGKALDPQLYEQLMERLRGAEDAKKAFAEPLYKKRKDGTTGPIVRSVKLTKMDQKSGLLIDGGKALVDRDSTIRVDIFVKKNKKGKDEFYFVPVYAYQAAKKELPNKVCAGGNEKFWIPIDDTFIFKFSLYPRDLVMMEKKGRRTFGYYVKAGVSGASLVIAEHDDRKQTNAGIKTLDKFEKYVVDVLGTRYLVKQEKRLGF